MSTTISNLTLQIGDTGTSVRELQELLLDRVGVAGLTADGIFGPITELAVRVFQQRHFLANDGIVGPQTLGVLLNGGVAHLPNLRRGDQGVLVERLQRALFIGEEAQSIFGLRGFYFGVIDGDFGPQTEQAVRLYQNLPVPKRQALSAIDGIVGPETWAALTALVARVQHISL